jgi:hypothetical protein
MLLLAQTDIIYEYEGRGRKGSVSCHHLEVVSLDLTTEAEEHQENPWWGQPVWGNRFGRRSTDPRATLCAVPVHRQGANFWRPISKIFVMRCALHSVGSLTRDIWPLVPKIAGSNPAEAVGFLGRKNPQHAFLRKGSKAVCPMSQICGM